MKLNGKVAIITGGGTGIGEAVAKLFAEQGAYVAITGRRKNVLEGVQKSIIANGGKALVVAGSVTDETHVKTTIEQTLLAFGKVDILVNNAAIGVFGELLHEMSDQTWDDILQTNLTGVFRFTRAVLPYLLERGGAIVNVSSISGLVGIPKSVAYSATKGALISMTRALAVDYAKDKIRCNCVCPGLVETPMAASICNDQETKESIMADYPIGRFGTPHDVAKLLLYLVSEEASWVTGSVFPIDGGYTAR